ncbi:MAG: hypothetical protein NWE81_02780 [Candidatus Bathyarchaeota archaeon]|jgi:hypothetical protein|nr:hypothetical protein [Candidatus Bathyarchaeota archaeon]
MPINKKEFRNGKLHSEVEEKVVSFLNERKDRAFTSQEVMEGIHYHTEFSTPEITKMSAFAVADFTSLLYDLAKRGTIKMKIVRGRMFFIASEPEAAKCPRCGVEIGSPKKTWKMAGRPNKKGERLQLEIGLYYCPTHGAFRTVLGKQKIRASKAPLTKKKRKTKPAVKKRQAKKTTKPAKKARTKKKPPTWPLI